MIRKLKRFYSFLKYNKNKILFFQVVLLSAFYRFCILVIPEKFLRKFMGNLNQESDEEETEVNYRQAARISHAIKRVCDRTPWQSKCLVRALTAQNLLKKKNINSTLYLGVGNENGKMVAHSWIRCGKFYLTGGCGDGYALVAKFKSL